MFMRGKRKTDQYTKSYDLDQVEILNEAIVKLLSECQGIAVRNNLNGGDDLTEDELKALHAVIEFLGHEHLDMLRFILDHQDN